VDQPKIPESNHVRVGDLVKPISASPVASIWSYRLYEVPVDPSMEQRQTGSILNTCFGLVLDIRRGYVRVVCPTGSGWIWVGNLEVVYGAR